MAQLADAHPELTIVLNHVGSPILGGPYRGKGDEVFADWKAAILRVSERHNVFVKLGAMPIRMPSYDGDRTLPPGSREVAAAWRPWMETCIEAFGPERSMYESNFPVQNAGAAIRCAGTHSNVSLQAPRHLEKGTVCWCSGSGLSYGESPILSQACLHSIFFSAGLAKHA